MDAASAGHRRARMMSAEPPSRKRCGARSKRESGNFCARYVVPGKTRCNLHGGKSTGPRKPARLTPERLAAMHEGRRRWVKGLKETGQKGAVRGDFTKSAKGKAECARLHEDLVRKANEAMFRANPELISKAFDRLAEAARKSPILGEPALDGSEFHRSHSSSTSAYGSSLKCHPPRRTAAYGSKVDPGKPSNGVVYEFTP